jgi:hypothetical protein
LVETLGDAVREINTSTPDCEVDPSRLGPGSDIDRNWSTLNQLTSDIWSTIACSASRCPAELRQVLKYIRAVAEDRYGDFLRTVPYTSVSGFLFLRFFCPALLNPKLFGLLRDHPKPRAQRALTLVAKSLQVLANLSAFGQKEGWMEPMNRFLGRERARVKEFIDEVTGIPTESKALAVPAQYSTPLAIRNRLPEVRREGWPSLPYLIDGSRAVARLVDGWMDSMRRLESGGVKIEGGVFEGEMGRFVEACRRVEERTKECYRRAQEELEVSLQAEQDRERWKDLASSIHELTPVVEKECPFEVPSEDVERTPAKMPGSSGSELTSKERKERASFWEGTWGKSATSVHRPDLFLLKTNSTSESRDWDSNAEASPLESPGIEGREKEKERERQDKGRSLFGLGGLLPGGGKDREKKEDKRGDGERTPRRKEGKGGTEGMAERERRK